MTNVLNTSLIARLDTTTQHCQHLSESKGIQKDKDNRLQPGLKIRSTVVLGLELGISEASCAS